jgi:hypothetical protein
MIDSEVIFIKSDCLTKRFDYDVCTIPCTPKAKDMRVTTYDKNGNIVGVFNGSSEDWHSRKGTKKHDELKMTKAKQLLLESSLIAKDMEILVLKEKLEIAYKNTFKACVELTDEQVKNIELNKHYQIMCNGVQAEQRENTELTYELNNSINTIDSLGRLLKSEQEKLAKIPTWIKWLFK